ncbi:hypothetical protein CLV51_105239 [Chitinophaga niastensis]|uniref:Uncharacterized protein n=1 Tax=Chitinophaga niastensis TaxID=536980 RepID=A0A2P8HF76_CHINA|nr:hypothetical protein [Chitinophaga niastensis]PSL44866.1 hypothetical protein CLV51_105239 [Chitinophaga niastensis]
MIDLKKQSKELLKILWLPGEDEIIFNTKSERPLPLSSDLYRQLIQYLDIDKWKRLYAEAYKDWLNDDSKSVYKINDKINLSIIEALVKFNKSLDSQSVYYWFDIDRTFTEGFTWEYCPISGKKLIYLGDEYPKKNAFVSPEYPLILPDYDMMSKHKLK